MGQSQDYQELKKWLGNSINEGDITVLQEKLSNFHALLYIRTLDILSSNEWSYLLKAALVITEISNEERIESLLQLLESPGWQTMAMILQETA